MATLLSRDDGTGLHPPLAPSSEPCTPRPLGIQDVVYLITAESSGPVCVHCRWRMADVSQVQELPGTVWVHTSPALRVVRES